MIHVLSLQVSPYLTPQMLPSHYVETAAIVRVLRRVVTIEGMTR